jgi:hypothetical protein
VKLHAFVLHNISEDMFWGFKPESSRLFHAHTFTIDATTPERAAEIVWILTNVDSADDLPNSTFGWVHSTDLTQYADQVIAYRRRRNRSLSVGDVVLFYHGEEFLVAKACEGLGWKDYSLEEYQAAVDGEGLEASNRQDTSQAYRAMQEFLAAQRR